MDSSDHQQASIAGIPRDEFAHRVSRAREAADARGLDGLIVLGRGGGAFERHGDLLYLTGHYSTFPTIADQAGHWRLRGHAAAVIGGDRVVLCTDDAVEDGAVAADDVRVSDDLAAAIGAAVADSGLRGRRIGLVRSDAVPAPGLEAIAAETGPLTTADDLVEVLRRIKSAAEQDCLRRAGRVGSAAIEAAVDAAVEGATEMEAMGEAFRVGARHGAVVANAFTGVYRPGRPARRRPFPCWADDLPMAPGDVFGIDMSGSIDGYLFDFSRSRVVGDDRYGGEQLIDLVQAAIDAAVAVVRPGTTAGAVARAGFGVLRGSGAFDAGRFPALGHGLGLGFEDPWLTEDNPLELAAGMCLAIENWTGRGGIAATFEHNVLVTEDGAEILSIARERW